MIANCLALHSQSSEEQPVKLPTHQAPSKKSISRIIQGDRRLCVKWISKTCRYWAQIVCKHALIGMQQVMWQTSVQILLHLNVPCKLFCLMPGHSGEEENPPKDDWPLDCCHLRHEYIYLWIGMNIYIHFHWLIKRQQHVKWIDKCVLMQKIDGNWC